MRIKTLVIVTLVAVASISLNVKLLVDFQHRPVLARGVAANQFHVVFSPRGGCTDAIVSELKMAKKSIKVLAYSFTSKPIGEALAAAKKRGVDVRVVVDKSQVERYSLLDFIVSNGIPILVDYKHAIQHNKVIVVDGAVVVTGSFNFSAAAEKENAENLLIIRSVKLADEYTANWNVHAEHSDKPDKTKATKGQ